MKAAIIAAGGTGTRMESATPKQFLLLAGKPLLMHSLLAFVRADPGIYLLVALPEEWFPTWKSLLEEYHFPLKHTLVPGGKTRFFSVKNCLDMLDSEGLVAIHDGARPLLSRELILRTFDEAGKYGNAIPAIPVTESIRQVRGEETRSVNRDRYRIIQTPQVFRISLIRNAYHQEFEPRFTDDATVFESTGESIHLVEGDPLNIKVTCQVDLSCAECFLGLTSPGHERG